MIDEAITSGLGTRIKGGNLDSGIVHLRQRRLRQQPIADDANDEHRQHQQAGRDRTPDKRLSQGFMLSVPRYSSGLPAPPVASRCLRRSAFRHRSGRPRPFARRVALQWRGSFQRSLRALWRARPGSTAGSFTLFASFGLSGITEVGPRFLWRIAAPLLKTAAPGAAGVTAVAPAAGATPLPSPHFPSALAAAFWGAPARWSLARRRAAISTVDDGASAVLQAARDDHAVTRHDTELYLAQTGRLLGRHHVNKGCPECHAGRRFAAP